MNKHETVNYIELAARDLTATKTFFEQVFNWRFEDFGNAYTAFYADTAGLDGGFYQAEKASLSSNGGALIIFYSNDLAATQSKIKQAGGDIVQAIFEFPGGKRFHFTEPSGNEFAVWSDQ
ncbi:MAG: VOC family protein [Thiotrichales bacterium]|nr:VOC family protein [Thiotrichales bacterium]